MTLNDLVTEYAAWIEAQDLPKMSAGDLIMEPISKAQFEWLQNFIERWETAEEEEM